MTNFASALRALRRRPIATAVVPATGLLPLFPEEQRAVAHAVSSRRADFAAGRSAARKAIAQLGLPPVAIAVGPRREPVWPPGVVGSISHASGWAIAAVARADAPGAPRGLGIDVEVHAPLAPELEPLVLTAGDQLGHATTLLAFSAKESVYKALFPTLGWLLEFSDVAIEVVGPEAFRAVARSRDEERTLEGRFTVQGPLLLTAVTW
jgi:4'-phosphopantetheinyl transferase EntD